jgi:hypothetical protein
MSDVPVLEAASVHARQCRSRASPAIGQLSATTAVEERLSGMTFRLAPDLWRPDRRAYRSCGRPGRRAIPDPWETNPRSNRCLRWRAATRGRAMRGGRLGLTPHVARSTSTVGRDKAPASGGLEPGQHPSAVHLRHAGFRHVGLSSAERADAQPSAHPRCGRAGGHGPRALSACLGDDDQVIGVGADNGAACLCKAMRAGSLCSPRRWTFSSRLTIMTAAPGR